MSDVCAIVFRLVSVTSKHVDCLCRGSIYRPQQRLERGQRETNEISMYQPDESSPYTRGRERTDSRTPASENSYTRQQQQSESRAPEKRIDSDGAPSLPCCRLSK